MDKMTQAAYAEMDDNLTLSEGELACEEKFSVEGPNSAPPVLDNKNCSDNITYLVEQIYKKDTRLNLFQKSKKITRSENGPLKL